MRAQTNQHLLSKLLSQNDVPITVFRPHSTKCVEEPILLMPESRYGRLVLEPSLQVRNRVNQLVTLSHRMYYCTVDYLGYLVSILESL